MKKLLLLLLIIATWGYSNNKVLSEKLGEFDVDWLSAEKQSSVSLIWPNITEIPNSLNSYRDYINGGDSNIPKKLLITIVPEPGKLFQLQRGSGEFSFSNPRVLEAILQLKIPIVIQLWVNYIWKISGKPTKISGVSMSPKGQTIVTLIGYDQTQKIFFAIQGNSKVIEIPYDYLLTYAQSASFLSNKKTISIVKNNDHTTIKHIYKTVELTSQSPTKIIKLLQNYDQAAVFEVSCHNVWSLNSECQLINAQTLKVSIDNLKFFKKEQPGIVKVLVHLKQTKPTEKLSIKAIHSTFYNWGFSGGMKKCGLSSYCAVWHTDKVQFFEIPGNILAREIFYHNHYGLYQAVVNGRSVGNSVLKIYPVHFAHKGGAFRWGVSGSVKVTYQK